MVKKVINNPLLPTPRSLEDLSNQNAQLIRIFSDHAFRLNKMAPRDGSEGLDIYTVATLPAVIEGAIIYVSDEAGGATIAFGDGTDWRRVQDRAIVS